jgi:hypothetical protein
MQSHIKRQLDTVVSLVSRSSQQARSDHGCLFRFPQLLDRKSNPRHRAISLRGLELGPINTFPGLQALGRNVKGGERALTLCRPITRTVCTEEEGENERDNESNRVGGPPVCILPISNHKRLLIRQKRSGNS